MPSGQHLAYWDSDKARALVNARGLELSNHWGPVDAHKELSEEVLAQFFGTRASYYQPPSAEVCSLQNKYVCLLQIRVKLAQDLHRVPVSQGFFTAVISLH